MFLIYFNIKYMLYIDLDINKQFNFKIIVYYIKFKSFNEFKVLLINYLI